MRFIDLFAGLGGFHRALRALGHECVFASEIDVDLQRLYNENFKQTIGVVHGDIRQCKDKVPEHDILCAGFPCQPFSKSGEQNGLNDKTRGTLFHDILYIIKRRRPLYVILENVGNFERHDQGRTWKVVRESLEALAYNVRGTAHVRSGGHGLISPHQLGYPHTRERFFAVASLLELPDDPFPRKSVRRKPMMLSDIVQPKRELSRQDLDETALTGQQIRCIEHWNELLQAIPREMEIPWFPVWGDEIYPHYPYDGMTPHSCSKQDLLRYLRRDGEWLRRPKAEVLKLLPSYARVPERRFPDWKVEFIRHNRRWLRQIGPYMPEGWARELRQFPPSLRKLEWNCKGEERNLWRYVLQFRPSGLRAKRYTSCPSLVAMTDTQIPILGPKRRFLTRIEGLRLQGFPDGHRLPQNRASAFQALGNAVHVQVVKAVASSVMRRVVTAKDGQLDGRG